MIIDEDELPAPAADDGCAKLPLDLLGVAELQAYIDELRAEIARVEAEIGRKTSPTAARRTPSSASRK